MAQRYIHYEAAFEDYVRSCGWPYIPVDEQKKAIFSGARIKSFDFIVYRPQGPAWLADIKGRKFPYDSAGGPRYWENWVTADDVEGLRRWESVFGKQFEPVFVFVYWLTSFDKPEPVQAVHCFRERYYALGWVAAREYVAHARVRSPKWNTLDVPRATFRKLIRSVQAA